MTNLKDYVLHSGGAKGSDEYWGKVAEIYGSTINHYYHEGHKTPFGNFPLNDAEIAAGWEHVLVANATLKRKPWAYKSLLSRNWFQVKFSSIILAIGYLTADKTQVQGGTGWAVQMAIDNRKLVYVFDQDINMWFTYNYKTNKFEEIYYTPILEPSFAGIGTRELKDNGSTAIYNVFKQTIKQLDAQS